MQDTTDLSITFICAIFPDICFHLYHYRPAAVDPPVASAIQCTMLMPFVITFERPSKDRCCRLPVWFGHDTDVSTLNHFLDISRSCRCSPDSVRSCLRFKPHTRGELACYSAGIMYHYPAAAPLVCWTPTAERRPTPPSMPARRSTPNPSAFRSSVLRCAEHSHMSFVMRPVVSPRHHVYSNPLPHQYRAHSP